MIHKYLNQFSRTVGLGVHSAKQNTIDSASRFGRSVTRAISSPFSSPRVHNSEAYTGVEMSDFNPAATAKRELENRVVAWGEEDKTEDWIGAGNFKLPNPTVWRNVKTMASDASYGAKFGVAASIAAQFAFPGNPTILTHGVFPVALHVARFAAIGVGFGVDRAINEFTIEAYKDIARAQDAGRQAS